MTTDAKSHIVLNVHNTALCYIAVLRGQTLCVRQVTARLNLCADIPTAWSNYIMQRSMAEQTNLHGIIYAHSCCDRASRGVDKQLDVL